MRGFQKSIARRGFIATVVGMALGAKGADPAESSYNACPQGTNYCGHACHGLTYIDGSNATCRCCGVGCSGACYTKHCNIRYCPS
jgi:hypothetical protein